MSSFSDCSDLYHDRIAHQVQARRDYLELWIDYLRTSLQEVERRHATLAAEHAKFQVEIFARSEEFPDYPLPRIFVLDPLQMELPRPPFYIPSAHEPIKPSWDLKAPSLEPIQISTPVDFDLIDQPGDEEPIVDTPASPDPCWRDARALVEEESVAPREGNRRRLHSAMESEELQVRIDISAVQDRTDVTVKTRPQLPKARIAPTWTPRFYDSPEDVMPVKVLNTFIAHIHALARELEPEHAISAIADTPDPAIMVIDVMDEETESSDPGSDFEWDWDAILACEPEMEED
jgi:hypothetical protein